MTHTPQLTDPTDLDGLRSALAGMDKDLRLSPLGIARIVISATAHLEVLAAVKEALATVGKSAPSAVVILTTRRQFCGPASGSVSSSKTRSPLNSPSALPASMTGMANSMRMKTCSPWRQTR